MARGRLMALCAIHRAGRRMLELGDGPLLRAVALGAIGAEEALVFVFGAVAGSAI